MPYLYYTHEDKVSQPTQCTCKIKCKSLPRIILRMYIYGTRVLYLYTDVCDCYVNTLRIVINQGSQAIASLSYWIAVFVGSV